MGDSVKLSDLSFIPKTGETVITVEWEVRGTSRSMHHDIEGDDMPEEIKVMLADYFLSMLDPKSFQIHLHAK